MRRDPTGHPDKVDAAARKSPIFDAAASGANIEQSSAMSRNLRWLRPPQPRFPLILPAYLRQSTLVARRDRRFKSGYRKPTERSRRVRVPIGATASSDGGRITEPIYLAIHSLFVAPTQELRFAVVLRSRRRLPWRGF
jgi:hypothetical protein